MLWGGPSDRAQARARGRTCGSSSARGWHTAGSVVLDAKLLESLDDVVERLRAPRVPGGSPTTVRVRGAAAVCSFADGISGPRFRLAVSLSFSAGGCSPSHRSCLRSAALPGGCALLLLHPPAAADCAVQLVCALCSAETQ